MFKFFVYFVIVLFVILIRDIASVVIFGSEKNFDTKFSRRSLLIKVILACIFSALAIFSGDSIIN